MPLSRTVGRPKIGFYQTNSLDSHLALIKRQVTKSLRDVETIQLARKLISGQHEMKRDPRTGKAAPLVQAWGKWYRAPTTRHCGAKDAACEIQAIWDFWQKNVRYTLDPDGVDTFATLQYTLEAGAGDCDDAAVGLCALLKAVGFRCAARVISTDGKHWEHVYALVGCPKGDGQKWIPLDPTVKGATIGWQYDAIKSHRDFIM